MNFLLTANAAADTAAVPGGMFGGLWGTIIMIAVMFLAMWFMIIKPQKKEQKRLNEMHAAMTVGDYIVTTSGFYGVIIDITDEDVIVEFGNNKNCRIPMKRTAIAQVEKADS